MIVKIIKRASIFVGVLILLFIIYISFGFCNENTVIDYNVQLEEGSNKLQVTMTVQPNKLLFLDLFIFDYRNQNGDFRVENLKVFKDGEALAHWKTIPLYSSLERIWVGFDGKPITVKYTVDSYVERGSRGKAVSFLNENYGYLRGMCILYSPITYNELVAHITKKNIPESNNGKGSVKFILPDNWYVNDPWAGKEDKALIPDIRDTYWGLGRGIELIRNNNISIAIIESMNSEKADSITKSVDAIYNEIQKMTGILPKQDAPYWSVSIVPPVPVHGGSSGNYSLVTQNDISTICHEMFHWWNGFTLKSENEATWFKEGFTRYYEGKVLFETGIWTEEEYAKFLQIIEEELIGGGESEPINLIDASVKLEKYKSSSMEDYYKVYNGGALLALYIDTQLEKEQKSLDEIWRPLHKLNKAITTKDIISVLEGIADEDLINEVREILYGKKAIKSVASIEININ